jgi:20S proteasome alpha/beta subunit
MRLPIAGVYCALFLVPISIAAAEKPMDEGVVHGTINIALGNRNGLVVLTDSMITETSAAGTHQKLDPGQKLFKLDDRSVCAVAGFISAPASSNRVVLPDLNTSTSAIIHEYVRQSALLHPQSIAEKLRALAFLLRMHLEMIANVRDAAGSPTQVDLYLLELIIAGFDIDDKPKIGKIVIQVKNDRGGLISEVEHFSLSNVEERLVVKLNGMRDVADQILLHPESKSQDAAINLYAENSGESLTVEQMVELAKRLAFYTSQDHREVGGPNQVAIFKKSQTVSIEQPPFPEPVRPLLRFSLIVDSHFSYSSIMFGKGTAIFVRCSWVGMQHELDGHYYIESDFINSVLKYDGGNVNLGDTNRVTDSVLLLGPHAILEDETVRRLTAAFSSLRVAYEVPKPKPWQMVP